MEKKQADRPEPIEIRTFQIRGSTIQRIIDSTARRNKRLFIPRIDEIRNYSSRGSTK